MTPTPIALYRYFEEDGQGGYAYEAFHCDLFGILNWISDCKNKDEMEENINMFYGLYKGLYLMGVSAKEIYRCYLKNRLDDLIHIKYSIYKSGYYKEFCEKELKIGNTFLNLKSDSESDSESESDEPYIYTNISPPYDLEDGHMEREFELTSESRSYINDKIRSYKNQDREKNRNVDNEEYCDVETVVRLINKQDSMCYVCGDKVIFEESEPYCLYQFTLDRIDNSKPHNKDNVLLCCYYCNCRHAFICQQARTKICQNGCHTHIRNITRSRNNISEEEIHKLLLN